MTNDEPRPAGGPTLKPERVSDERLNLMLDNKTLCACDYGGVERALLDLRESRSALREMEENHDKLKQAYASALDHHIGRAEAAERISLARLQALDERDEIIKAAERRVEELQAEIERLKAEPPLPERVPQEEWLRGYNQGTADAEAAMRAWGPLPERVRAVIRERDKFRGVALQAEVVLRANMDEIEKRWGSRLVSLRGLYKQIVAALDSATGTPT